MARIFGRKGLQTASRNSDVCFAGCLCLDSGSSARAGQPSVARLVVVPFSLAHPTGFAKWAPKWSVKRHLSSHNGCSKTNIGVLQDPTTSWVFVCALAPASIRASSADIRTWVMLQLPTSRLRTPRLVKTSLDRQQLCFDPQTISEVTSTLHADGSGLAKSDRF
jgi:hypothetical protein